MAPARIGRHLLPVQVQVGICGAPSDRLVTQSFPFFVDSCQIPPPVGCLLQGWGATNNPHCNAYITPLEPARLVFTIATPVGLSGLQGELTLGNSSGSLRIAHIEAIASASGMHLSWIPTEQGARFVLFAEHGAPIGPSANPIPVLAVAVTVQPGHTAPPQSYLNAFALLGSDSAGHGVPACPIVTGVRQTGAIICSGGDCDDNGDGRVDVRDLVLLVQCLQPNAACPATETFDCNQDSNFSLDDVICCARRILIRPDCPNCPPDTTPQRKEPMVQLAFGSPRTDGGSITVPIRLTGAARLGAARFALKYPTDRYDVAAVEFPGAPSEWLTLYEVRDGEVVVGLVGLDPRLDHNMPLDVTVRLALKPGQTAGGQVSWASSEFSGTDGASLEITMAQAPLPLAGPASVALSAGRPNPFSSSTSFTLTLSQAAAVEIGVFDVGGRSVASIQKGSLAAGSHSFEWNGRTAGGAAAGSGIYFIRATAGAESATRRMVLLRAQ